MTDQILSEIVRRLVAAYRPERIYLFGSAARGDAGPDSGFDLLVIVPDGAAPEQRDSKRAYEVLWGTKTAADVIVWEKSRFDRRAHVCLLCQRPCSAKGSCWMRLDPELVAETG